jgi:hypothetical protein
LIFESILVDVLVCFRLALDTNHSLQESIHTLFEIEIKNKIIITSAAGFLLSGPIIR